MAYVTWRRKNNKAMENASQLFFGLRGTKRHAPVGDGPYAAPDIAEQP